MYYSGGGGGGNLWRWRRCWRWRILVAEVLLVVLLVADGGGAGAGGGAVGGGAAGENPPEEPTPVGAFRFNTDTLKLEYYDGNQWVNVTTDSTERNTGGINGFICWWLYSSRRY